MGAAEAAALALAWLRDAQARAAPLAAPAALLALRPALLRRAGRLDEAATACAAALRGAPHDASAWREWSLVERGRAPALSFWLGARAADEALRAGVGLPEVVRWCEGLAPLGRAAGLGAEALVLARWAVERRARAGAPPHDDTVFLSRALSAALGAAAPVPLDALAARARAQSDEALAALLL